MNGVKKERCQIFKRLNGGANPRSLNAAGGNLKKHISGIKSNTGCKKTHTNFTFEHVRDLGVPTRNTQSRLALNDNQALLQLQTEVD